MRIKERKREHGKGKGEEEEDAGQEEEKGHEVPRRLTSQSEIRGL